MQQICSDIAHYNGNSYIVILDRFSNWVSIYKFTKAEGLLKVLRSYSIEHGVPDKLSSDDGPEYTSPEVKGFLGRWGLRQRVPSAYHPEANLRVELGVKVAKKIAWAVSYSTFSSRV